MEKSLVESWRRSSCRAPEPVLRFCVTTVKDIQAALPHLSAQELALLDAALRDQLRKRKMDILYDDSYGVWTAEDQASAAAQAFAVIDLK